MINDQCDTLSMGMDSSYHLQTKVSVRRGIIWGISIQSMHKGEVYFHVV